MTQVPSGVDGGRPQDQGRRHVRAGAPSPATRSLLTDYHEAMRVELRATLTELEGVAQPDGLHGPVPPKRPTIEQRARLWDLAIKLGRELGTEVDKAPGPEPSSTPSRRPRRRVDYGGE